MQRKKKLLLVLCMLMFIFASLTETCLSQADKFGIGQFSVNPQSFNPYQGETTTISGVVYHFSPEGNLSSPSIIIKINDQLSLSVEVNSLSKEILTENSLVMLGEWSFSATWDGRNERGEIVSSGKYTFTINLDLPNVGKDTKLGTITVNAIE